MENFDRMTLKRKVKRFRLALRCRSIALLVLLVLLPQKRKNFVIVRYRTVYSPFLCYSKNVKVIVLRHLII
jgi:hypothetical protein